MATRRFVSKEVAQVPSTYIGEYGELWMGDDDTTLRVGNDTTPGGIVIGSGGGGNSGPTTVCPPNANTVVYTATTADIRTIKVLAQAEGFETGVYDYRDAQGSEIMAVYNQRTGNVDVSAYGITYTSVSPLVVYNAQYSVNGIEIIAAPTSTVNNVIVKTLAFEISTAL